MTAPLDHECTFVEVVIGQDGGPLKSGMRVLLPCTCGERALDALSTTVGDLEEAERAFAEHLIAGNFPLYHWTPTKHRKQIIRRGLVPHRRPVTHPSGPGVTWRTPYICFADTPSLAWALSGAQRSAPSGEWDLWQTWANRLTEPRAVPDVGGDQRGVHEIRTQHRVYKSDLWLCATRTKPAATHITTTRGATP